MNHYAVAPRKHVITVGGCALAQLSLVFVLILIADRAMAQTVQGSATYRERLAMPAGAVFEATIEDVSKSDAPALGAPTTVSLMLRRAGAGAAMPPDPASPSPQSLNRPNETTYWKAIEIAGKPVRAQSANREAHLSFQPVGRVTGSDGCNKVSGTYELKGDAITFGQIIGTQMACTDNAEIERAFQAALRSTTRWKVAGDRLELLDAAGKVLAAFQGRAQTPPPAPAPKLAGTTWQLVKFQGGDGRTLTPDDKSKYVIEFGPNGQLTARIDCNRGRGTWKGSGTSQLELGPLVLSRAKCPEGSLHDQIVKQWANIRSFIIKDGHLFLSLMADAGIYEFEPIPRAKVRGKP